jgi:hypothetical protein
LGAGAQTEGVWRDGWRTAERLPSWAAARWPLSARLAALVFCLVGAGGGALTVATHLVARDYLTRQAGQQLRSYAAELSSRPFTLFPGFRVAPAASGLGVAGSAVGVSVRSADGQQLIGAGPAIPPKPSSGWLEISEPVSYRADHIPFVYGADDSSFSVTSKIRSGYAGTLVVGQNLADVGRTVGSLTLLSLQVTGLAALVAAGAAAVATGILYRPREAADASARDTTERTSAAIAETCRQLRRPLSVLAGLAEYHRGRSDVGDGEAERVLRQVAEETGRMSVLVDQMESAASAPEPEKR